MIDLHHAWVTQYDKFGRPWKIERLQFVRPRNIRPQNNKQVDKR